MMESIFSIREKVESRKMDAKRMEKTVEGIIEAVKAGMGPGYEADSVTVEKNNGVVLHGIQIWKAGDMVRQVVYVDRILERIGVGEAEVMDAANEIANAYRNNAGNMMGMEKYSGIIGHLDKDQILEGAVYRLVGTRMNTGRLEGMPHKEYLDLSAVYRMALDEDGASIEVTWEICKRYGISLEELDTAARRNTAERGFRTVSMADIFAGAVAPGLGTGPDMYMVTSRSGSGGAAVMLYPEYFEELAQEIGNDLYILPSSIHEVIAVPACGDPDDIRGIVEEVNRTEVSLEEILSWSVYKYSRKDKRVTVACSHEKSVGDDYKRQIMERFTKVK